MGITSSNVDGILKVAGAITAAGAISEKYAGIEETALTKAFKGDVWSTNPIIAMVTGVATNVLYSMGASDFDGAKLQSALWLVSVVVKLMDSSGDFASLMQAPVEPVVALLVTALAWMRCATQHAIGDVGQERSKRPPVYSTRHSEMTFCLRGWTWATGVRRRLVRADDIFKSRDGANKLFRARSHLSSLLSEPAHALLTPLVTHIE